MINTQDLLRKIWATGADGFNHRKLSSLLCGVRGSFSKKDIQLVRKVIRDEMTTTDKMLAKLENE
jgi:hypothetical protein